MNPADNEYTTHSGPMGTVRACKHCRFSHFLRPGKGQGRGYGMREGNKARGVLIQHIKAEHPETLKP